MYVVSHARHWLLGASFVHCSMLSQTFIFIVENHQWCNKQNIAIMLSLTSVSWRKKTICATTAIYPTWWLEQPHRAVSLEVIAHVNAGLCAPCVYHVCRPSHSENMANFLSQHLSVWWFWPIDLGTGVQCHDPWQVQPHRQFWCFCIWITTWRYNRDLE